MNPRHFRRLLVFVAGLTIWASLPSLVVLPQPSLRTSAVQTRIFQEGADGYTGLADTWISANDWADPPQHTVNYGLNPALTLSRDGDDNPLLRYDSPPFPATAPSSPPPSRSTTPANPASAGPGRLCAGSKPLPPSVRGVRATRSNRRLTHRASMGPPGILPMTTIPEKARTSPGEGEAWRQAWITPPRPSPARMWVNPGW